MAANSVVVGAAGTPLSITFPSLRGLARELTEIKNFCGAPSSASQLPRKLVGAKLILSQVVDERWTPPDPNERRDPPACLGKCTFEFENVVFDGAGQLAQSVSLSASADTIVADPIQGTGKIRLTIKIDKDLDSATVSFSGASPSSLPTLVVSAPPAAVVATPTTGCLSLANPVVCLNTGTIKVTPAGGAAAATTVVLDVPLQGLVVGRAVIAAGTGTKGAVSTTSSPLVLPVAGPSAAPKSSTNTP